MFARTTDNLPADPAQPDMAGGSSYKVENGQILQVSNSKHFPFHSTENERANVLKRAMVHAGARYEVKMEAAAVGLQEIYVIGKEYTTVKPEMAHLPILTTNLKELETKNSVLIVIGEHTQDLGIWAYRHLMSEGGIDGGSVVGLMKALNKLQLEPIHEAAHELADVNELTGAPGPKEPTGPTTSHIPGVIILNPGQLLYSNSLNQCMTQKTWMAREKPSAIGFEYKIDEVHNRVSKHTTPYEHVYTMFEDIIPQLISEKEDVRLCIVGITDGAENFIKYFDSKLVEDNNATIGALVTAMAFMEPTHRADKVASPPAKTMLHSYGKCWIKSSKPKGTWINVPGGMNPIMSPKELAAMEEEKQAKKQKKEAENKAQGQQVDADEPLAGSMLKVYDVGTTTDFLRPENQMPPLPLTEPKEFTACDTDDNDTTLDDPTTSRALPPEAYNYGVPQIIDEVDPVMIAKSGNENAGYESAGEADMDLCGSSSTDSDSPPGSLKLSRMSTGNHPEHPTEAGSTPLIHKAVLSLKSTTSSADTNTSPTMNSPAIDGPGTPSPQAEESEDGNDAMADSYDYTNNVVSCHTYSGGTDIDEMIWPNVMGDVLDFFQDVIDKEDRAKRRSWYWKL